MDAQCPLGLYMISCCSFIASPARSASISPASRQRHVITQQPVRSATTGHSSHAPVAPVASPLHHCRISPASRKRYVIMQHSASTSQELRDCSRSSRPRFHMISTCSSTISHAQSASISPASRKRYVMTQQPVRLVITGHSGQAPVAPVASPQQHRRISPASRRRYVIMQHFASNSQDIC